MEIGSWELKQVHNGVGFFYREENEMKKINSKDLHDYVNELEYGKEVKFKVYRGNSYITDIYWNGVDFCWESGKFTSGAFFDYDYWFEPIEDKIEKLNIQLNDNDENKVNCYRSKNLECELAFKINEIIDKLNSIEQE